MSARKRSVRDRRQESGLLGRGAASLLEEGEPWGEGTTRPARHGDDEERGSEDRTEAAGDHRVELGTSQP